jgi:hypothetical protein
MPRGVPGGTTYCQLRSCCDCEQNQGKSKDMGCRNQGGSPLSTRHGRQNQANNPCFMIVWCIIAIYLGSFVKGAPLELLASRRLIPAKSAGCNPNLLRRAL